MENTGRKYNSELVSFLAKDNFRLLGMIAVLRDITTEFIHHRRNFIEKKAMTIMDELAESLLYEIKRKTTAEQKILFREIEKHLSTICSTDMMRDDHIVIGALASYVKIITSKKSYTEFLDHGIEHVMKNLYLVYKKHTYKTCEMLYYEMETFLTKEELNRIYNKLTVS